MVWTQTDEAGNTQVYYQNLATGHKQAVTSAASEKDVPKVGVGQDGHVYIVWLDKRNYAAAQPNGDLYAYDMSSAREWKLNGTTKFYVDFAIGGSDVVVRDNYSGEMYWYDLKTGTETNIGKGRSPKIAGGSVLYLNDDNGGLSLRNLRTGTVRSVLNLPSQLAVINFTYNGTYALFKEADPDWNTKYVMLDVSNPAAIPVDLTPATKKVDEYYQLYLGDHEAAWVQNSGSGVQLLGADLQVAANHPSNPETHVVLQTADTSALLAFSGDRLVTRTQDGKLSLLTTVRTVIPDAAFGAAVAMTAVSSMQKVGPDGGVLSGNDGKVRLIIPSGAFAADTIVGLSKNDARSADLMKLPGGSPLKPASDAWDVQLGGGLKKPVQLSFTFDPAAWSETQMRKLVVQRWNEAARVWEPAGGKLDKNERKVTADIDESGTYALLANNVTFGDVEGHWSQDAVEVLAARGIVSGTGDGTFSPDQKLTRAQFTKMLLGALGIQPSASLSHKFSDVPASHWSAGWVEAAASYGIVQGENGVFRPDDELTREQMIVMLVRALGDEAKAGQLSEEQLRQDLPYDDSADISDWAKRYAALSSQNGLIEGDGKTLQPKQSSTRAQAAAVIYRLLQRQGQF
jgi:hypothetical protein